MNNLKLNIKIETETESSNLAELFSTLIKKQNQGLTIFLNGNLGAGKTTFTRYLLKGLGHLGKVKSPTYTIVECYQIESLNVYHFDFYRFSDPEEWEYGGFREYFKSPNICVVEWAEKLENYCPPADIIMDIEFIDYHLTNRNIELTAKTKLGDILLEQIHQKINASR